MARSLTEDATVVFAGLEDSDSHECSFGFYVPLDLDVAIWLTGYTDRAEVGNLLKAMKPGQEFKIVAERDGADPIGTLVEAIEVRSDAKVHQLPDSKTDYLRWNPD